MTEQIERLSATEYDIIEKALWDLVKQYPKEPTDPQITAQYDALDADTSLAVFTLPGGQYKKRYVSGNFTATISFRVAYKSNPKTSPQRINAQAFVGRIMKWLENTKDLPLLTDGREITKIIASNAVPYLDETGADKSTVYVADAVMEYIKKGH